MKLVSLALLACLVSAVGCSAETAPSASAHAPEAAAAPLDLEAAPEQLAVDGLAASRLREQRRGWFLAGSKPASYAFALDPDVTHAGAPSRHLNSIETVPANEFGTGMRTISAYPFRNQRVRLSAYVKTTDVVAWDGLWMRVDGPLDATTNRPIMESFDNMQDRPVVGTTEWTRYEVVLNVPGDAESISLGILLVQTGAAWISEPVLETVSNDVPTTGFARSPGHESDDVN